VPEERVLALQGARLVGAPLRGAVLVLHDITHLRRLERMRQEFVANVSHELKTPLASIKVMVETLLDGALDDPEHNVAFLERVRESAERLDRLVQDLLTLNRIQSGAEVMEIRPVPMDAVMDLCVGRYEHRARAKHLALKAEPPPAPVHALADEDALDHILDNLVDNAVKYTPEGGRVTLRWSAVGPDVLIEVEDTGVGIPAKDLPRVFERFYRVDRARSRELGGTGLGLSIVKHLTQALGGRIDAKSTVGQGTTFTLCLPLAVPAPTPPEPAARNH
jgi:two-component system phosphate regulon sensor histidine kinase PhoR